MGIDGSEYEFEDYIRSLKQFDARVISDGALISEIDRYEKELEIRPVIFIMDVGGLKFVEYDSEVADAENEHLQRLYAEGARRTLLN